MIGQRVLSVLRREPLLGFALAGGLIFLLYALSGPAPEVGHVVVTPQAIDGITAERELVLDRPLSPDEREALIQRFIDEEILVREAYALGLDRVDGRVRSQLIKKMTFLIEEEPPQPTEADLAALYEASPEHYRLPARIGIRQVVLDEAVEDAASLLSALRAGKVQATDVGAVQQFEHLSAQEVAVVLGKEQANVLMEKPVGEWSGPYSLPQGDVLVQLTSSQPSREFSAGQLERYLREDWETEKRREIFRDKMAELRNGYRIEIQAASGALQAAER